jgi:hypothetical protein
LGAIDTNLRAEPNDADWPVYLGGKERNLYSPLQQINRGNVSQLAVAWTYETGDKNEYQANNSHRGWRALHGLALAKRSSRWMRLTGRSFGNGTPPASAREKVLRGSAA